jgi:signal transduction histidine kinase
MTLRTPGRFAAWPVRRKLLAMVLLPLVGVLPLLGLVLLVWGNAALDRLLITKVRSDMAVAHGYFDRVLGEVAASTGAVADSQALYAALQPAQTAPGQRPGGRETVRQGLGGDPATRQALQALLARFKDREALDFINLRAPDGQLLLADFEGASDGPAVLAAPGPAGRTTAAIVVLPPAAQGLLSPALRQRVAVPLVATQQSRPTERSQEDRAMVVRADAPVLSPDGRVLAWVQAGVLLNRNLPFIDHINRIVYPDGALPFGSQGTATLFLDDVRISTNVRLFDAVTVQAGGAATVAGDPAGAAGLAGVAAPGSGEQRAIGTRVSLAVRDAVLGRGSTWLDRAFVVNDWYVSAYQPLSDVTGQRVGMLYVGYLERPFTWMKYSVLAGIGGVFFAVMIAAALWSARRARTIFRPIEQMAHTMRQVEGGALAARVGPVASFDEIGALAGHLDHLLDTLADHTAALQRWNAELDAKVAERTLALANRTAALEAAQAGLLRAEKMATVGQLTASIAHEVNNPIAVIQGNLDLVRELLGTDAQRIAPELALADQQIERMRLIVTQLLQFARPNEFAGYVEAVAPGQAIEDCLVLTGHLLAHTRIQVLRDFCSRRSAAINRFELQQVLVNLLVNAIHAMPDGGTLTLATADWTSPGGQAGLSLSVTDTGPGLSDELLRALFQPFVTRKPGGTGLGLWISRGIVERYGGDIRAGNRPPADGPGACLTVLLLCEPALTADA